MLSWLVNFFILGVNFQNIHLLVLLFPIHPRNTLNYAQKTFEMRMSLSVNQDILRKPNLLRKLSCGQCPSAQLGLSLGMCPCLWFEWLPYLQMQIKQMMRRIPTTQRTVEQKTILTWKRYVDSNHLEMNFNLKYLFQKLMYSNSKKWKERTRLRV